MQKNNNTAIVGLIAVVVIIAAGAGVIFLLPKDDSAKGSSTGQISNSSTLDSSAKYKDGTYSANGSYLTPGGNEEIAVTITINNGKISDATVQSQANNPESEGFQSSFESGYKDVVIGKAISTLSLNRVSGASLTTQGFNSALNDVRSQAKI